MGSESSFKPANISHPVKSARRVAVISKMDIIFFIRFLLSVFLLLSKKTDFFEKGYTTKKNFSLLYLGKYFRGVCIGLDLWHHSFDIALLVDHKGSADNAHTDLAVKLFLLPHAVSLNGFKLRI